MSSRNHKITDSGTVKNKVELIRSGFPYFNRLLKMINDARESIHVQVYIFDDDETGCEVAEALKSASHRGVEVYILADGYASRRLSKSFIRELREAGIHFRYFEPLFRSDRFYFGRRLHQKVVVTDTRYALVGGINISNNYNDLPGKPAWMDFALYLEGEAARELCILCWKAWNDYPLHMDKTPCESKRIDYDVPATHLSRVLVRRNDWVRRKNQVSATYMKMLLHARSEITILCSYFLPGSFIRRQLAKTAARGVKIKVITTGVSDVPIAKHAERYIYDWLIRNGIEIYEYQPTVLHGKLAVCDDDWVTIGSYNINNLSTYASIELNLDIIDQPFSVQTKRMLDKIIENQCVDMTREYRHRRAGIFKKLRRWFSFGFIRAGLFLSTFYYRHTVAK